MRIQGGIHRSLRGQLTRRVRGRRLAAICLATALALPAVVLASHSFADVPDSNPFHTNIARVYGARITAGCGGSNYCPSANVTREQMAAFLARTGGRGSFEEQVSTSATLSTSTQTVATVTIKAGDVTGGTAYVLLVASYQGYTFDDSACPCQGFWNIQHVGESTYGNGYMQVDHESGEGYGIDSGSLTTMVAVPTGVTQTFNLTAFKPTAGGALSVFGSLTATYIPFASDGSNAVVPLGLPVTDSSAPGIR